MKYCLTGGCGFIGSNFIEKLLKEGHEVLNLDALTYAASQYLTNQANYKLLKIDISQLHERPSILKKIIEFNPDYLVHFAAESMVDRSLENNKVFIQSNVVGTWSILELLKQLKVKKAIFSSTDETYGSFEDLESYKVYNFNYGFKETDILNPKNPYAGAKAAADQLTQSYVHNFKLPISIIRPCNNHGQQQHAEKFIPKIITNITSKKKIPVYGNGTDYYREWLYVSDTCNAISLLIEHGNPGEIYNIGSGARCNNIQVINKICELMGAKPQDFIEFITDRKGHDKLYAINSQKIRELGWKPQYDFEDGLAQTISSYLN